MPEITREEFSKVYREKFLPILNALEPERIEILKKTQPLGIVVLVAVIFIVIGFISEKVFLILLGFCVAIPLIIYISILQSKIRAKLKKEIVSKILALFGNLYFSENKDVIPSSDIKSMGLFPRFATKSDDDIIIGIHQGLNFAIDECSLTHTERHGKSSTTVTDFRGLIIKIQMKKNFSGRTIVGMKWEITKRDGFEEVVLEDVNFMKNKEVYSTDQIEARYILTTAFMERLHTLGNAFSQDRMSKQQDVSAQEQQITRTVDNLIYSDSWIGKLANSFLDSDVGVSAAFMDGYVYLFVPSYEDFFEVDINSTLYNEAKYYNIYVELQSILAIIDYLKLDSKLGL